MSAASGGPDSWSPLSRAKVVIIDLLAHNEWLDLEAFTTARFLLNGGICGPDDLFIFSDLSPFKHCMSKAAARAAAKRAPTAAAPHTRDEIISALFAEAMEPQPDYARRGNKYPRMGYLVAESPHKSFSPKADIAPLVYHALYDRAAQCAVDAVESRAALEESLIAYLRDVVCPRVHGSRVVCLLRSHGGWSDVANGRVLQGAWAIEGTRGPVEKKQRLAGTVDCDWLAQHVVLPLAVAAAVPSPPTGERGSLTWIQNSCYSAVINAEIADSIHRRTGVKPYSVDRGGARSGIGSACLAAAAAGGGDGGGSSAAADVHAAAAHIRVLLIADRPLYSRYMDMLITTGAGEFCNKAARGPVTRLAAEAAAALSSRGSSASGSTASHAAPWSSSDSVGAGAWASLASVGGAASSSTSSTIAPSVLTALHRVAKYGAPLRLASTVDAVAGIAAALSGATASINAAPASAAAATAAPMPVLATCLCDFVDAVLACAAQSECEQVAEVVSLERKRDILARGRPDEWQCHPSEEEEAGDPFANVLDTDDAEKASSDARTAERRAIAASDARFGELYRDAAAIARGVVADHVAALAAASSAPLADADINVRAVLRNAIAAASAALRAAGTSILRTPLAGAGDAATAVLAAASSTWTARGSVISYGALSKSTGGVDADSGGALPEASAAHQSTFGLATGLQALTSAIRDRPGAPADDTAATGVPHAPWRASAEEAALFAAVAPAMLALPSDAVLSIREQDVNDFVTRVAAARVATAPAGTAVPAAPWMARIAPDAGRPKYTHRLQHVALAASELMLAHAPGALLALADMIEHSVAPDAATGSFPFATASTVPRGADHGWPAAVGIALSLYHQMTSNVGDAMGAHLSRKYMRLLHRDSDDPTFGLRVASITQDTHFGPTAPAANPLHSVDGSAGMPLGDETPALPDGVEARSDDSPRSRSSDSVLTTASLFAAITGDGTSAPAPPTIGVGAAALAMPKSAPKLLQSSVSSDESSSVDAPSAPADVVAGAAAAPLTSDAARNCIMSGVWATRGVTLKVLEQHLHDTWLRSMLSSEVHDGSASAGGASKPVRSLHVDSQWVLAHRRSPRTGLLIAFGDIADPVQTVVP